MQINFYLLFSSVLAVCKNTNGLSLYFMFGPLSNVKTHNTRLITRNQFSCLVIQLKYCFLWISQKIICILMSFKVQVLCQKYYPRKPYCPNLRSIYCLYRHSAMSCLNRWPTNITLCSLFSCYQLTSLKSLHCHRVKRSSQLKTVHMELI